MNYEADTFLNTYLLKLDWWGFGQSGAINTLGSIIEVQFGNLIKLNTDIYPQEMKIMEIPFEYFYNGVNIDGGYFK